MSVRLGIVGAGLWTERAHLPAFTRLRQVKVCGIADPDVHRARQLANAFGVAHACSDHRELLDLRLDAIAIVAPDDVHHAVATAAIQMGLPILCEKPLARTVAEAADLVTQAARARVVTKLGFAFRYSPALRRLRQLVHEGFVGRVHSLVVYSQNPQFMTPGRRFTGRWSERGPGGGVFVEYGSHSLDLARWIVGELVELCANARTVVPERPDRRARRAGPLTSTTCVPGSPRWKATWKACSMRAGCHCRRRAATSPFSAIAGLSYGAAGTISGPLLNCSARPWPLPRFNRCRSRRR